MRAAEIRFFWYRAELFSLFSPPPRAMQCGAPFLFFLLHSTCEKTRGARNDAAVVRPRTNFPKNRRVPKTSTSLSFLSSKSLDRKEPPERVFFRQRRAHTRATQTHDANRLLGGRGRVSNLRERASRLLGKEYKGRQNRAPILFFS